MIKREKRPILNQYMWIVGFDTRNMRVMTRNGRSRVDRTGVAQAQEAQSLPHAPEREASPPNVIVESIIRWRHHDPPRRRSSVLFVGKRQRHSTEKRSRCRRRTSSPRAHVANVHDPPARRPSPVLLPLDEKHRQSREQWQSCGEGHRRTISLPPT